MTRSVYILGGSGSGKSTAMAHLLDGWAIGPYTKWTTKEMFGHTVCHPSKGLGAYLGHLRDAYPGTDALSLSVQPQALLWLDAVPLLGLDWVFGEGVKLSNPTFLAKLASVTDLTVVYLDLDPEEAARRRAARGGKQMTERWATATFSRARNAAQACREAGIRVVESCAQI